MDVSFFLNHSKSPNCQTKDDGHTFFTITAVPKGMELTVDYGTYDCKLT